MEGTSLFIVDTKCSADNEIEILVDSDGSVNIDECVALSRAIEAGFDRDAEDFSLTVMSAGIGRPLKVYRQYAKLVGRPVEVLLRNGVKMIATLTAATPDTITVAYDEKVAVEGRKRKETVRVERTYDLDSEVKSTCEWLDFK